MLLGFCVDVVVSLTNTHDLTTSTAAVKNISSVQSSIEPKEKKHQPEGSRLKKVPIKAPEMSKQVRTHSEITRHHNLDVSVHGTNDSKEKYIETLIESEVVSDASQESDQSRSILELDTVTAVKEAEKEIRTRSHKKNKEDKLKVPGVVKKKVDFRLKEEEKWEGDLENIQLKKVPLMSKEPEEKVVSHQAEVKRHHDAEVLADILVLREYGEVKKTEHLVPEAREPSDLGHLHKFRVNDIKNKQIRAPEASGFEEPDKNLTKKINKLQQLKEKPELVKLKQFEKLQKSETKQPSEKKESETKTGSSFNLFQRSVAPKADQLRARVQLGGDQLGVSQRSNSVAVQRPVVATPNNTKELLTSRPPHTNHQQEDQADAASEHRYPSPTVKTAKDLQTNKESLGEIKPNALERETTEEKTQENQTDPNKKELKSKMTPLFKVVKGEPESKPVEQILKAELKKTPSPKDRSKKVDTDERFSTIRLKKTAAAVPETPKENHPYLVKQVSPGAVQVNKVPTRLEEEVFEEVAEKEEIWGWELLPFGDWTDEGLNGAVETPGPPGSIRGEVTMVQPLHSVDLPSSSLLPSSSSSFLYHHQHPHLHL